MDFSLLAIPLFTVALITAMILWFSQTSSTQILQQCIRRMKTPTQFWSSRRKNALREAQRLVRTFRSGEDRLLSPTNNQVQRWRRALAMAFFKLTAGDRIKVILEPLPSRTSSLRHLPDRKVDIIIHDRPHLINGFPDTTSLVSFLLRELCVA